jgi:Fe-S-cluster-containing dehydrogenase component
MYEFEFRTGKVIINHNKCVNCTTYACVKACSLYGRGVLIIHDGKPLLIDNPSEGRRLCTECLACEQDCRLKGQEAITITLPTQGLKEFKEKINKSRRDL